MDKKQDKPADKGPDKIVTQVRSLGDLARRKVTVVIERQADDGIEVIVIPCQTFTWKRWNELGMQVPDPTPPINGVDKSGRPNHNFSDPTYLQQKAKVDDQRLYLRLVEFLDIEIPGETAEEKIAALEDTLEVGLVQRLAAIMGSFTREGEARIESRAATFLSEGQSDSESVPAK